MTNANTIEIKIEDTLDNLNWNIQYLTNKTEQHEQCSLAVDTLISNEVDINGYEELRCLIREQSEDIDYIAKFVAAQYTRLHNKEINSVLPNEPKVA